MAGIIDVLLDAEDEVTPEFTAWDCGFERGREPVFAAQAARTDDSGTLVNLDLDACIVLADGSKLQRFNTTTDQLEDAWREVADALIVVAAGADDGIIDDTQLDAARLRHGMAYRLRYDAAAGTTDEIRVVVHTPYRDD